ncbi:tRNA lysidine(34) synthetase TilS [Roseivirga pacifica]
MLERFLQFIKKHALFNAHDKLLVATSGGVDSIVLCNLLLKAEIPFAMAHCNFQLRGKAADGDEAFVKAFGSENDIAVFTIRFETEAFAQTNKISTQMAARELRYKWFEELKEEHGFAKLLTAHHLNDHVETLLLGLSRGGGVKSLTGIPKQNDWIVRPLLVFTKEEVLAYAQANEIEWREDASNASTKYKRNFVRHELVPRFEELNPNFLNTADQLMERTATVAKIYEQHINRLRQNLLLEGENKMVISIATLVQKELSVTELADLLAPFGFAYEQCQDLLENLAGLSGRIFKSPTHELLFDRTELRIREKTASEFESISINKSDRQVELGELYRFTIENAEALPLDKSAANCQLDFSRLTFPLEVRKWKEGDKFTPLGMKGQKLVSDFLIDQKVAVFDKEKVLVMLSDGEIAWVVGHRISDKFKRNAKTQQVAYFKKISVAQG